MSAEGRSRAPEFCSGMRPPVALGGRRGMAPDCDGMSEAAASQMGVPDKAGREKLHRQGAKAAKEQKSFTAKDAKDTRESVIRTNP